ncbi:hypothetical protein ACFL0M_12160 [Thermodesulfobacteriota bacterium]
MLDVAVSYNRYKFIGFEFLTWLWFMMENHPEILKEADGDFVSLDIGNRLVLEKTRNKANETITIKGDQAGLEEGVLALKKGAVVTELNLIYKAGSHEWRFSVKGESLNISGLKTPQTGPVEKKEDIEGAVLEKVFLYEKVFDLANSLYKTFIRLRVSNRWEGQVVPRMRGWIAS